MKIVVWKDGSYRYVENGVTWECEDDPNWLVTIPIPAEWRNNPDGTLSWDPATWDGEHPEDG